MLIHNTPISLSPYSIRYRSPFKEPFKGTPIPIIKTPILMLRTFGSSSFEAGLLVILGP